MSGGGTRTQSFGFDRFSGLYILALFVVVFGVWTPGLFLSMDTVHSIASQQAIVGFLALAVLIPMTTGVFDLSVGVEINLSAVLISILQDAIGVAHVAGHCRRGGCLGSDRRHQRRGRCEDEG